MDRPCIRRIICPGPQPGLEADSPVTNYSSEYNDGVQFDGYKFPTFDPYDPGLPGWWSSEACAGAFRCVSYISQDDADACAALLAAQCGFSPPLVPPDPPTGGPVSPCSINPASCFPRTATYLNSAQSCDFTCPDGTIFTATVPAGTVMSISQALADSVAKQMACNRAIEHHICFSDLSAQPCLDVPYEGTGAVLGNDIPYTVSYAGGSLPSGLTFEVTAFGTFKISGTPTVAGNFDITVTAVGSEGSIQSKTYTIEVLGITNDSQLPQAYAGSPYNVALIGAGGTAPYTFSIADGDLPDGLTLSTSGIISGTATQLVTRDINFRITDANGRICQKAMFIEVICSIGPESLPNPVRSQWYSQFLTNGGVSGTTWTIVDGALPTGLSLNAVTGEISGSPDDQASYQFTVRNADGDVGCNKEYSVTVQPAVGPDWAELAWGAPSFFFENGSGVMTFTPQSASGASFFGSGLAPSDPGSAEIIISGTLNYDGPLAQCAFDLDLTAVGGSTNPNCLLRITVAGFVQVWPLSGGSFNQSFPFVAPDSGGTPYVITASVTIQSIANVDGSSTIIANGKFYTIST